MAVDISDLEVPSAQPPVKQGIDISDLEVPMNLSPTTQGIQENAQKIEPGVYGDTDPAGQKILENLGTVASGYGTAKLAAGIGSGIASFFQKAPTLLSAGIKPITIAKMVPNGVNPADFGQELEQKLTNAGALGKGADAWDKMNNFTQTAGQRVGSALNAVSQSAGPQALTVDAETALKPIYDAWGNEVNALVPDTKATSTFGKYYSALANVAQQQGGKLTLDNIHDFLQEIGPKTHTGTDAMQDIYSKLYSVGADARDGVVNTVAQQANSPALAQNLLSANNDYSTGLRLLPDVKRAASAVPIKEGMSTFQKVGGPTILKYAAGVGGLDALKGLIPKSQNQGQ